MTDEAKPTTWQEALKEAREKAERDYATLGKLLENAARLCIEAENSANVPEARAEAATAIEVAADLEYDLTADTEAASLLAELHGIEIPPLEDTYPTGATRGGSRGEK